MKSKTFMYFFTALFLCSALYAAPQQYDNSLEDNLAIVKVGVNNVFKKKIKHYTPKDLSLAIQNNMRQKIKEILDSQDVSVESELVYIRSIADTPLRREFHLTPLTMAAMLQYKKIVKMLIDDYHAEVNRPSPDGKVPLWYAACSPTIIQILIDKGANVDGVQDTEAPLLEAARYCSKRSVETFINNNANVNVIGEKGRTPLHEAVYHILAMNSENVQVLVDNEADINIQDEDGNTPMHIAVTWAKQRVHDIDDLTIRREGRKIAEILFKKHPDLDTKRNKEGKTVRDIYPELITKLENKNI